MSKDLALILSNKVNISDKYTQLVEYTGVQVQEYQYASDNTAPGITNQIQFQNITPIGSLGNTLMSKRMYVQYQVQVVVTDAAPATGGGAAPYQVANVSHVFPTNSFANNNSVLSATAFGCVNSALRSFPLQQSAATLQMTLNSSTTTTSMNQVMPALVRLLDTKELMTSAETCPTRPDDQVWLYPDTNAVAGVLTGPATAGHCQSTQGRAFADWSRACVTAISATKVGGVATYVYDIQEPLICPGVNTLYADESFLPNINNLSIVLSGLNLQNLYSSAPLFVGGVYTVYNDTVVVSIATTPQLCLQYIQVDNELVTIPPTVTMSYEAVNYFTSPSKLNTTVTQYPGIFSQTLRLLSCPSKIVAWVGLNPIARSPLDTDSCLALDRGAGCVNISYGARSGILANADRQTIYKLSREAGNHQTYQDFCSGSGSFVCLDPVKHFGINISNGDLLPGENGSVNFMIQMNLCNQNVLASLQGTPGALLGEKDYQIFVAVFYKGTMSISSAGVNYNLGILSESEVKMLTNQGMTTSSEAIAPTIAGASLYGNKSVLHKNASGRNKGGVLSYA